MAWSITKLVLIDTKLRQCFPRYLNLAFHNVGSDIKNVTTNSIYECRQETSSKRCIATEIYLKPSSELWTRIIQVNEDGYNEYFPYLGLNTMKWTLEFKWSRWTTTQIQRQSNMARRSMLSQVPLNLLKKIGYLQTILRLGLVWRSSLNNSLSPP